MKHSKREILVSETPYEKRIAVLEGGELMELVVEGQETTRILGNIYKGTVQKVLPALKAAFIDLGIEKAGFLHVEDVIDRSTLLEKEFGDGDSKGRNVPTPSIDKLLKEGEEIMVQVIKEPISTKGPRLTTHLVFPGRFLVCMPQTNFVGISKKERDLSKRRKMKTLVRSIKADNVGYIVRTNGLNESERELRKQMQVLNSKWQTTQENYYLAEANSLVYQESNSTETTLRDYFSDNTDFVYVDDRSEYRSMKNYLRALSPDKLDRIKLWSSSTSLFEQFNIEDEYERTIQKEVGLRRGGYLVIEQTEALVSIDINTGHKVHGSNQSKIILETNMDACHEIAKQMRLRDVGGLVIIDFIDMDSDEDRHKVENEFKKAIRKDKAPVHFIPLSPFCLMEVTRKRVRQNLLTEKSSECKSCAGRGLVYSPLTVISQVDRWMSRSRRKKCGLKKLSLVVSAQIADSLLDNSGEYYKYLEDKHDFELEVFEDEGMSENEYRFFNSETGDEMTQQYLLGKY